MRDAGLSIKAWLDINDNNYDTVIFFQQFNYLIKKQEFLFSTYIIIP